MISSRKVKQNTLVVKQGEQCGYIFLINYGTFLLLRNIDFIEAMNEPIANFVNKNATNL